jgi:hypothetical protein
VYFSFHSSSWTREAAEVEDESVDQRREKARRPCKASVLILNNYLIYNLKRNKFVIFVSWLILIMEKQR